MPSVQLSLSILYEPVDEGWTQAQIVELPEVITAAPTRSEAKEMVLDALREYLLSFSDETADRGGEREPVALTITA
jgi:predicted RNase H-like HicB family nuclease